MKGAIWFCAGLSLAAHAGLLAGMGQGSPRAGAGAGGPTAAPLSVRVIEAPRSRLEPAGHAVAAAAPLLPASSVALPQPPRTGLADATMTPPAPPAAVQAPQDPRDEYLPRPLLTVGPAPRAAIALDYPSDGPIVGRYTAKLTLYIDGEGQVRHLDFVGDEALPDVLRRAAREAFTRARFTPGQLDGRVVKSRIRVEVVYESLALPTAVAAAAPVASAPPH